MSAFKRLLCPRNLFYAIICLSFFMIEPFAYSMEKWSLSHASLMADIVIHLFFTILFFLFCIAGILSLLIMSARIKKEKIIAVIPFLLTVATVSIYSIMPRHDGSLWYEIMDSYLPAGFYKESAAEGFTPYNEIDFLSIKIDETEPDYLCLKNAPYFAYGPVGLTSKIPAEFYAFGRLLKKENALDYFYKLEQEANNQGILYALCGIYYLDYHNYAILIEKYSASDGTITVMSADTMWNNQYIRGFMVNAGAVRLKNNQDTVEKWLKRNFTHSFAVDFYGGAIPCLIKEYSEYPEEYMYIYHEIPLPM